MIVNGQGIIQPQILTYAKIKQLIHGDLPKELQLPPFPNAQVDNILTASMLKVNSRLVYQVKIPLLQREKFNVYKIIPFPLIMTHIQTAKFLQPQTDYIATYLMKTKYVYMKQKHIDVCKAISHVNFICPEINPINYLVGKYCITGLLQLQMHDYPNECQPLERYMTLIQTCWIPLSQSNDWLFIAPKQDEVTIICDNEEKIVKTLSEVNLLSLHIVKE